MLCMYLLVCNLSSVLHILNIYPLSDWLLWQSPAVQLRSEWWITTPGQSIPGRFLSVNYLQDNSYTCYPDKLSWTPAAHAVAHQTDFISVHENGTKHEVTGVLMVKKWKICFSGGCETKLCLLEPSGLQYADVQAVERSPQEAVGCWSKSFKYGYSVVCRHDSDFWAVVAEKIFVKFRKRIHLTFGWLGPEKKLMTF